MRTPQSLVQAALNRLVARVGSGLADTAAGLAVLAQDAPARLQQELSLFWEEVEQEAERLERGEASGGTAGADRPGHAGPTDPQSRIDALRAKVAELSRRLDQEPQGPAA